MAKLTAEDVLTTFVKGDVKRDYDQAKRKYYRVSIDTALRAMRKFHKLKSKEL